MLDMMSKKLSDSVHLNLNEKQRIFSSVEALLFDLEKIDYHYKHNHYFSNSEHEKTLCNNSSDYSKHIFLISLMIEENVRKDIEDPYLTFCDLENYFLRQFGKDVIFNQFQSTEFYLNKLSDEVDKVVKDLLPSFSQLNYEQVLLKNDLIERFPIYFKDFLKEAQKTSTYVKMLKANLE